jgi:putative glutamine amidotransferase
MEPPLIGITTYGRGDENEYRLPAEYADAVRRAGGIIILLAPGTAEAGRLLDLLDGIVLAGGGDLDPALYGGSAHEMVYNLDAERDASELSLARGAVERGTPTLAICRGVQVVNVALGGSLVEHVPDVYGDAIAHRLPPRVPTEHAVSVRAGSRLAAVLGATDLVVASWHHQALRDVAPGLEVAALAPDGVIEAVEMPGHPWLFGIQWHPELTPAREPAGERLFAALVAAARERAARERAARSSRPGRS